MEPVFKLETGFFVFPIDFDEIFGFISCSRSTGATLACPPL
jgi:hypothetical protein